MSIEGLRKAGGLALQAQAILRAAKPPQKYVIDFSSPNVAKQFHIGNLRSTIIGRYVDQVHRTMGEDVCALNYLGDWGTQFALIASYWPQNRPSDAFWTTVSDDEKVKMIQQCYVVANKLLKTEGDFRLKVRDTYKKMEDFIVEKDMEDEVMLFWNDMRGLSERHLKKFYRQLGIQFDQLFFESEEVAGARKIVEQLIESKKAVRRVDGLWVVETGKQNPDGTDAYCIVRKSDDTTLYLTRDVASIIRRDALFKADKYLYVVDRGQRNHFKDIAYILEQIGRADLADKIEHIPFGRVHGLSTRHGKTEAVADILTRGSELALQFLKASPTIKVKDEDLQKISGDLALDTIIVNDLKRARLSEYEFSFKNAFALNQNNALLLQEKHSRLCSLEKKNAELMPHLDKDNKLPEDDVAKELIKHLEELPRAIMFSMQKLEPCQLTIPLIHLAQLSGKVMAQLRVKDEPIDVAVPRLRLLSTARQALADGMSLLGISPKVEM
ncbi:unnamed protein product, partial [Mesorhabditis spiculigera]